MDEPTRTQVEAAAFRRLLEHFRSRADVQNVDVMNLAGFCRNCLAKWYRAEAEARGEVVTDEEAREVVYGMPYAEWKAKHQTPRQSP
jgi:DNA phosphorothioation-dependent restriction protein DptG